MRIYNRQSFLKLPPSVMFAQSQGLDVDELVTEALGGEQ